MVSTCMAPLCAGSPRQRKPAGTFLTCIYCCTRTFGICSPVVYKTRPTTRKMFFCLIQVAALNNSDKSLLVCLTAHKGENSGWDESVLHVWRSRAAVRHYRGCARFVPRWCCPAVVLQATHAEYCTCARGNRMTPIIQTSSVKHEGLQQLLLLLLSRTFAICISDIVPSCILAPPDLHCTTTGSLCSSPYSNALVIFSPSACPREPPVYTR